MDPALPSPSTIASHRSSRHVPLLSLAPPALALGDALAVGEPGEDNNVGEIWNVITRAADLVKDGERLENLAWRHWGQPRRSIEQTPDNRRLSVSSQGTASTASLHTPNDPIPPFLRRSKSFERRSFGGALRLLLEENENNFKDWVEDAKKNLPPPPPPTLTPPTISLPDTPIANVEIRLVEPTPVSSRVGSLGGSVNASGLLNSAAAIPPPLREEDEERLTDRELKVAPIETARARSGSPRRKGKFFVQSSPSKGSGSDSSHPSPTTHTTIPQPAPVVPPPTQHRRSSGGSSTGESSKVKLDPPAQRRHVSLSTMRGKFQAEKRRVAESMAKTSREEAGKNEESGWEDEDEMEVEEDWSDDDEAKAKKPAEKHAEEEAREDKLTEPSRRRSSSRPRPARSDSNSHPDLTALLTRRVSDRASHSHTAARHPPPAPPAPTPLIKMSKRERLAAAAERAKIEAQLEAQRKREMFAKKQIFGSRPSQGLLASALQRGASMVDLHSAPGVTFRPSTTHVHLPSLAQSPTPGPSLLRSKSAVAMPVQTGVSVTAQSHAAKAAESSVKGQSSSQERAKVPAEVEFSDEDSDDDENYLNTTQTRQKLAEIAAKRNNKSKAVEPAPAGTLGQGQLPAQAVPAGQKLNELGYVQPMSPTTKRRNIIMAEMSESLRRNVVLERAKSSTGGARNVSGGTRHRPPPSLHTSRMPTHSSAVNLTQYAQGEPLERHSSQPSRSSHDLPTQPQSHSGAMQPPPPSSSSTSSVVQPPAEPLRRRTQPSLLGGGFLRPLTRVEFENKSALNRTSSSATLVDSPSEVAGATGSGSLGNAAPMMARRSTDGEGLQRERERRELARRRDTTDTSYRAHGW
ncbi:hypothetical protein CI109_100423 [Kwoniella shandongensis]|uniref:Uncharacterized protein n=1 Tax=Kwoniella shandongensis TaxID=1734106 RepID=A0A5M6C7L5_9TREE|nr:uncharacterized protein CI109_001732 [Kwoniella shandongensis]KAA5529792.1 hypothetical protein CI109_001732 [Kwoniella shandongensis]